MKRRYFALVVATVAAHFAYLAYLPSGGFLALRWRRTFWLHVPTVCWGAAVVALDLRCPLTSLEDWARARAGMGALPQNGFIGRYVDGGVLPANRTGTAQALAFTAAALSWIALLIQSRRVSEGKSMAREAKSIERRQSAQGRQGRVEEPR
ncbi:DUF2784 domain-containing protein [Mycobacterium sp. Z3061]|uniref:DUF2784 domain-containing protein n=1 Tax=Mycobacterium sp. Z3061 TaxID=3073562 RepID=UPI002873B3BC|nr:DUF2784 domain-containing protein [Mycobacterium sp. Z3061]